MNIARRVGKGEPNRLHNYIYLPGKAVVQYKYICVNIIHVGRIVVCLLHPWERTDIIE